MPRLDTLTQLGWVFLKIGETAFGVLGAALTLVERELVGRRRLLTAGQVAEALTYTKLLPGSTVVQVVSYFGYRLGGWPGSAVATAAFVAPSAAAMALLAALSVAAEEVPTVGAATRGLAAAEAGPLAAAAVKLGRSDARGPLTPLARAAFAAAFFGANAAVVVVAAGLVGGAMLQPDAAPKSQGEGVR